jgi:hypothetical protein
MSPALRSSVRRFGARLKPAAGSGPIVLGAIFLLALFLASRGGWIAFPMTPSVPGGGVMLFGLPGGLLVLAVVVLALVASALSGRVACALLLLAIALLLRVPLEAATKHADWLQSYLVQTTDRLELSQYLAKHYVLNLSPEPALVPADRIDGTDDQLRIGWLMMGRPWYLALGTCIGLLTIVVSCWRSPRRAPWVAGLGLLVAALVLPGPLLSLERAQARRDAGDRALAAGDGAAALAAYRDAWSMNTGLAASRPFWLRVATAYAQASGGRHASAELVRPLALILQRTQQQDPATYAAAADRLAAVPMPAPADTLEAGLQRATAQLRSDLLVQQALLLDADGDRVAALAVMLRSDPAPTRAGRFYLADLTMQQGGWLRAAELLKDFDSRVAQTTLRADIACTMGDAFTGAGRLLEAREAYLKCKDFDELTNYRLPRALGGT